MLPTFDQIQNAAYHMWESRGYEHGQDRNDWSAAEQALLFVLNYEVVAHYLLDGAGEHHIGSPKRRVCRYCEHAIPASTPPRPAVPSFLGNRTLLSYEECDSCQEIFREGIEQDLARFIAPFQPDRNGSGDRKLPALLPMGAFKGFVRLALAIAPRDELATLEGAIEWVSNPDSDFDASLFEGSGCYLHSAPTWPSFPWVALARRIDDDNPMPSLLMFVGSRHAAFEVPIALGTRDEEHDGEVLVVPRVAAPFAPLDRSPETGYTFIPTRQSEIRRDQALRV